MKEKLVKAAIEYARSRGWDVENYDVSSIQKENDKYYILFQGKSGLPGDHYTVAVNASTYKAMELIPGR